MINLIKVAINGYGTIGKRVADAVSKQDDMQLIGVTKTKPNYELNSIKEKNYPFYTNFPENFKNIEVCGSLEDLIKEADIIIDCTPSKVGKDYKPIYEKYNKKAIFQGGESSKIGKSFVASINYEEFINQNYVRIVSCNTTGLSRVLYPIHKKYKIKHAEAQFVRRGADPRDSEEGPISQLKPNIDSKDPPHGHHGPDVQTVIPNLDIHTMAIIAPTSMMHMHMVQLELEQKVTKEEIISLLKNTPRVKLVKYSNGFTSTGDIMEFSRELARSRGDMFETVVWEDSVYVHDNGKRVSWYHAIHQEADVIPENIDAIRAMFNLLSKEESIKKTNESLGIGD